MPYEQIRVEKQNSVCIITLNRPEKLNAWTPDMSRELGEAITAANEDDEIGAGPASRAGGQPARYRPTVRP